MASQRHRIALYERLAETNPTAYRPRLATVLLELGDFRDEDPAGALAAARGSVLILEQDIGILDYGALATLTPTPLWDTLSTALRQVAVALRNAGDPAAAHDAMTRRVALHRRLADADPTRYQAALEQAITDAAEFG